VQNNYEKTEEERKQLQQSFELVRSEKEDLTKQLEEAKAVVLDSGQHLLYSHHFCLCVCTFSLNYSRKL
jgi:hypothetical protein